MLNQLIYIGRIIKITKEYIDIANADGSEARFYFYEGMFNKGMEKGDIVGVRGKITGTIGNQCLMTEKLTWLSRHEEDKNGRRVNNNG